MRAISNTYCTCCNRGPGGSFLTDAHIHLLLHQTYRLGWLTITSCFIENINSFLFGCLLPDSDKSSEANMRHSLLLKQFCPESFSKGRAYRRSLHTFLSSRSHVRAPGLTSKNLSHCTPVFSRNATTTTTTTGFYDSNRAFQWQPGSEPGIDTSIEGVGPGHGETFPVNITIYMINHDNH